MALPPRRHHPVPRPGRGLGQGQRGTLPVTGRYRCKYLKYLGSDPSRQGQTVIGITAYGLTHGEVALPRGSEAAVKGLAVVSTEEWLRQTSRPVRPVKIDTDAPNV